MAGLTSEPSHLSSRAALRLPAFRSPFSFWAEISKGRFRVKAEPREVLEQLVRSVVAKAIVGSLRDEYMEALDERNRSLSQPVPASAGAVCEISSPEDLRGGTRRHEDINSCM